MPDMHVRQIFLTVILPEIRKWPVLGTAPPLLRENTERFFARNRRSNANFCRLWGRVCAFVCPVCAPCVPRVCPVRAPVWGMALYAACLRSVRGTDGAIWEQIGRILAVLRAGCSPLAVAQDTAGQNGYRAGLLALARQIAQSVAVQFGIQTLPR